MGKYGCFLICIFLVSCQSASSPAEKVNRDRIDTSGFLSDCSKWIDGSYSGYLQGVNSGQDSLGPFCFYESYGGKETFELVFAYKGIAERKDMDGDSLWNRFKNGCKDKYPDFQCFAFVYPMRDPDKQDDMHALNFDLPLRIRAYKRVNADSWQFLKTAKVKTFEAFGAFRFNAIYGLKQMR